MPAQNLEQRVTKGAIIYIDRIEREIAEGHLTIYLLASRIVGRGIEPVPGRIARVLKFAGVEEFKEIQVNEYDGDCLEQIIGVDAKSEGEGFRCFVKLNDSEIYFFSREEPQIEEVGLNDSVSKLC